MAENHETAKAIRQVLAQVTAQGEIMALLLAEHAERTAKPMNSLRDLSNRLSAKLEAADQDPIDRLVLEEIQREFDRIIAAARAIME